MNWTGSAVGIVRTEAECAAAFSLLPGRSIAFCTFAEKAGFLEIDREIVASKLESLRQARSNVKEPGCSSHRARWTAVLKRVTALLSRFRLSRLSSFYRRIWGTLYGNRRSKGSFACLPEFFSGGDVLISLGLDWATGIVEAGGYYKQKVGIKLVFVCYDIIPLTHPHLFSEYYLQPFANYIGALCNSGDELICISRHTRDALKKYAQAHDLPIPLMSIVTLGCEIRRPGGISEVGLISKPYILYVSSLDRRKNHEVLYRAYVRLVEENCAFIPRLIVVGRTLGPESVFENDVKRDPRVRGLIEIVSSIDDLELAQLYSRCLFTVFPSLAEGWGLPVAESLAFGKLCLCATTPSLSEVGGDLVEYLDPWCAQKWAERIAFYSLNATELHGVETKIVQRYVPPTWADASRTIMDRALAHTEAVEPYDEGELWNP